MSDNRIPLWLRVLDAVANRAERGARLVGAIRDETAIAWTRPEDRTRLTSALFDRQKTYLPGGNTFAQGLFYWECEMLVSPFPQQGRLLVGGAGGGREATVLADRGYSVFAFDPSAELVRVGAPLLAERGVILVCASYEDVVSVAAGAPSPLDPAFTTPFDGVLLGWGSLSLVVSDADRLALMAALRKLNPRAPVVLSFDELVDPELPGSLVARVREFMRRLYVRFGAVGYTGEPMRYASWAGIIRMSSIEEVGSVARSAGYRVEKHGSAPGRILLVPADRSSGVP